MTLAELAAGDILVSLVDAGAFDEATRLPAVVLDSLDPGEVVLHLAYDGGAVDEVERDAILYRRLYPMRINLIQKPVSNEDLDGADGEERERLVRSLRSLKRVEESLLGGTFRENIRILGKSADGGVTVRRIHRAELRRGAGGAAAKGGRRAGRSAGGGEGSARDSAAAGTSNLDAAALEDLTARVRAVFDPEGIMLA